MSAESPRDARPSRQAGERTASPGRGLRGSAAEGRGAGSWGRRQGSRTRRFRRGAESGAARDRAGEGVPEAAAGGWDPEGFTGMADATDATDATDAPDATDAASDLSSPREAFREEVLELPDGTPLWVGMDRPLLSRARSKLVEGVSRLSGVRKQEREELLRRKLRLQSQLADLERQLSEEVSARIPFRPAQSWPSGPEALRFGLTGAISRARERRARARLGMLSRRQIRDAAEAQSLRRELEGAGVDTGALGGPGLLEGGRASRRGGGKDSGRDGRDDRDDRGGRVFLTWESGATRAGASAQRRVRGNRRRSGPPEEAVSRAPLDLPGAQEPSDSVSSLDSAEVSISLDSLASSGVSEPSDSSDPSGSSDSSVLAGFSSSPFGSWRRKLLFPNPRGVFRRGKARDSGHRAAGWSSAAFPGVLGSSRFSRRPRGDVGDVEQASAPLFLFRVFPDSGDSGDSANSADTTDSADSVDGVVGVSGSAISTKSSSSGNSARSETSDAPDAAESIPDTEGRPKRHRKRRTTSKRSETGSAGTSGIAIDPEAQRGTLYAGRSAREEYASRTSNASRRRRAASLPRGQKL